jgi:hypothetical protein
MDIKAIKLGMQATLADGSLVEVKAIRPDMIHIRVKYIDTLDNPEIPVGLEADVPFEEVIAEYMGTHAEGLT